MKCPKCGNQRCRYVKSRKTHWKAKDSKGTKPRTDFTAECPCGFKGVIK